MCSLLSIFLNSQDCDYQIVSSGKEVLPLLKREPFNLLLLDLGLPDMYGTEVAYLVKNDPDTRNTPIIYFSANTRLNEAIEEVPVEGILSKPFELDELKKIIDEFLA